MLYADTSALAKLILDEPESTVLRTYVETVGALASSVLVVTELVRSVRRNRPDLEEQASLLLRGVALIEVDRAILDVAARLDPTALRSLDAIHLATALSLGRDLEALITYDTRMAEATRASGIVVRMPT